MNENAAKTIKLTKGRALEILKDFWRKLPLTETSLQKIAPLQDEVISTLQANPWIMKERVRMGLGKLSGLPFLQAALLLEQPKLAAYGITYGAPLEDRCPQGQTALHALVNTVGISYHDRVYEFRQLVDQMLAAGANPNTINDAGTPLWFDAIGQPMEVWEKLMGHGRPQDYLNHEGASGLARLAVDVKQNDKARRLVLEGIDVNLVDKKAIKNAPVMCSIDAGNVELADFLVANRANLHCTDLFQRGFLHVAKSAQSIHWLIEKGLDLEQRDAFGRTPLLHIMKRIADGNWIYELEVTAMAMIAAGADLDARDDQNTSASALEQIAAYKKAMPQLTHMLLALQARQVAMASLNEMDALSP